jgi:hypothetical protein
VRELLTLAMDFAKTATIARSTSHQFCTRSLVSKHPHRDEEKAHEEISQRHVAQSSSVV